MDEAPLNRVPPPLRPPEVAEPLALCASTALLDKGFAVVFDVQHFRQPARAFVLRFEGRVVGYLNRCLHVPAEMDWQEGEFLDSGKQFIMCSIHGAVYEPLTGRCAGGPCGRGQLTAIDARERDGQVYWYPSRDIQPAAPRDAAAGSGPV